MNYSRLISSLEESATLGISRRVRELKAEGKDVIGLTLGEPDFDTPVHIREAAKKALDDGYTHYPPVDGLPELKEAIVEKFKRDNGLTYTAKDIVVSTGAKQSLYNVVLAMLNPGDEAIVPTPFWVSYEAMLYMAQATLVKVPTTTAAHFKMTPEQLEAAITPKSKVLFLNSPSNPSGSMYTREEIEALVEVLKKYPQIAIISDEIYEYITFGTEHVSLASFPEIYERVITVNGFSKGFAMTGWRLGYIASPDKELVELINKVQGQSTSGANAFAMKGAVVALTESLDPTHQMRDEFRKRRNKVFQRIQGLEGVECNLPDGAFYFYPDFGSYIGKKDTYGKEIKTIDDLCMYFIEEEGIALVSGSAFGTDTHARISYAYSDEVLTDGMNRIERALAKLK